MKSPKSLDELDSFFDRITKLIETGLFGKELDLELNLRGTGFYYDTIDCGWYNTAWPSTTQISFEEVLEKVEPELQTKLLFHLDLFR